MDIQPKLDSLAYLKKHCLARKALHYTDFCDRRFVWTSQRIDQYQIV